MTPIRRPGTPTSTKPIDPGCFAPTRRPSEYRAGEAVASNLAGILIPGAADFDDVEAAGLPRTPIRTSSTWSRRSRSR